VSVSVTDTGTGMPAEVVKRAFEPFFTTKLVGQGTGLGLSMLYGFTKQSKGHARIQSEQGNGTTVLLYLPRDRSVGAESGYHAGNAEPAAEQTESGKTVLVVEDEAAVRMLVVEALNDAGYKVLEATCGRSGLQALMSATHLDLLVTDVGLPGLDGRQLADAARERRPDLKVLFITGYAYPAGLGQGAALRPGTGLVTKPFTLASFMTKVQTMINA
jgi:CheY-like chemotaxis protein